MVDPTTILQTADAVAGLLTLLRKGCDFCRRFANADQAAKTVYDQLAGIKELVEHVQWLLSRARQQLLPSLPQEVKGHLESNIQRSAQNCITTVEQISHKLGDFKDAESFSTGANAKDRARFAFRDHSVKELLAVLHTHRSDLGNWLQLLSLDGQLGLSSSTEDDAGVLSRQGRTIGQDAEKTPELPGYDSRAQSLNLYGISPGLLDFDNPTSGVVALTREAVESLNCSQRTVKKVREYLENQNVARALHLRIGDGRSAEHSRSSSMSRATGTINTSSSFTTGTIIEHDVVPLAMFQDEDLLTRSIVTYRNRAQLYQKSGQWRQARDSLSRAIGYAEQREREHGIHVDDKEAMQLELAETYRNLAQWEDAVGLVRMLLPPRADSVLEGQRSSHCETPDTAHKLQLLAQIYFDRYLAEVESEDWELSLEFAQKAFAIRKHLTRDPSATQDDVKAFHACTALHVHILRSRQMIPEAQIFIDLLPPGYMKEAIGGDDRSAIVQHRGSLSTVEEEIDPILVRLKSQEISPMDCLKCAIEQSNQESLRRLLDPEDCNLYINMVDGKGNTGLHHAAELGKADMVTFLLDRDAQRNTQNKRGETPLHKALGNDRESVVRLLLRSAKDITVAGSNGRTALHYAVACQRPEIMEDILTFDPSLRDNRDSIGQTALHYCVAKGKGPHAERLLEMGANPNVEDNQQRRPLTLALDADTIEEQAMFDLLMQHGATINESNLVQREKRIYRRYLAAYRQNGAEATSAGGEKGPEVDHVESPRRQIDQSRTAWSWRQRRSGR